MSSKNEVLGLVAEILELDLGTLSLGDHFIDDLGMSSLDIMTLVMRIEQHYLLGETPDDQVAGISTIADLVVLVDQLTSLDGEPSAAAEVVDVAIASDHQGVELKSQLIEWMRSQGVSFVDLGPVGVGSVDFPDFAARVGTKVVAGDASFGVLLCHSGVGMSIAANKIDGVRAALAHDSVTAAYARSHHDANVLCLGAQIIGTHMARECVERFLETTFSAGTDGRHGRRVSRIAAIERGPDEL